MPVLRKYDWKVQLRISKLSCFDYPKLSPVSLTSLLAFFAGGADIEVAYYCLTLAV